MDSLSFMRTRQCYKRSGEVKVTLVSTALSNTMADPQEPSDLNPPTEDELFFKNYIPPARDAIHMPMHVLYMVLATIIIVMTLYAIIGHLIKDLLHDFADWLFGKQPEEVEINFLEARDKFMADWCPETTPELEELARAEQIKVVMESSNHSPAIWVISDGSETRPPRAGPRVAFHKNT